MTKARDLANASTALSAVSATELAFVDGVTSAIQTQIDAKLATATAATTYVPNSLADAKGDLLTATADNTPARLAVGSNGETLIADNSTSTGLRYQGSQAAAKNYLINGAMDFWQRGTSSTSLGYVTADRWYINNAGGTTTSAQETTTVPSVARYALKLTQSVSSAQVVAQQPLESQLAIPLAGQTIIVSAYVAASASTNFTIDLGQSTSTDVAASGSWTFTSGSSQNVASLTYVRVSQTFTVSGTSKSLMPRISMTSLGSGNSFYISGVQMEISAVPTTFTRAGGTIQGELAACQRYYYRMTAPQAYSLYGTGFTTSTSAATVSIALPVTMRVQPASVEFSGITVQSSSSAIGGTASGATLSGANNQQVGLDMTGMSGLTANQACRILSNNTTSAYIGFSSEL